jgi:SOS-response transcriptional repressor LexA
MVCFELIRRNTSRASNCSSTAIFARLGCANNQTMNKATQKREADALKKLYKSRVTITQQAFGDLHQIGSQGMVWQYLNGTRPLNKDAATKFAAALNCQVLEFSPRLAKEIADMVNHFADSYRKQGNPQSTTHSAGEQPSTYNVRPAPPAKTPVPILTLIQAGQMKEIGYLPEPGEGERWEAPDHKLGAKGFCLIVEGWSMWDGTDDGIKDGDLVFCDPEIAPGPNDFVIAKNVGDQSATFKQLSYEDGSWYLRPLNKDPIYKTIEIDDPAIRVIAVVTEYRRPSKKVR